MQCSCRPQLQPKLLAGSLPCLAIGYITSAFGIEPEGREASRTQNSRASPTGRHKPQQSVQLV